MDCGIDITQIVEMDPTDAEHQKLLQAIQGNILKSHGRDRSIHLFLKFNDGKKAKKKAKAWIGEFGREYVTSAYDQSEQAARYRATKQSEPFVNFFLSMDGYMHLGFSYSKTPSNVYFRGGMQDPSSLDLLKDPPVDSWEDEFGDRKFHALIIIADDNQEKIEELVKTIEGQVADFQSYIHKEQGFVLREDPGDNTSPVIEHFGFRDGVSQPLFMKKDIEKARGNEADGFSKWDPRAPLNLVLVEDSLGTGDCSYGSYLVYRKLEQNVEGWKEDVLALSEKLDDIEPALAGAYVVGRFQDGTPVLDSQIPEAKPTTTNNFNYEADSEALKCPFHAHIRKTNPRGDSPDDLDNEKMHRIARRAISYGNEEIEEAGQEGSGLLFLCFQANLGNQFMFMQSNWANAPDFVERGVGADPVIGPGNTTESYNWPASWGRPEKKEADFTKWVTMKGGEYFFAPSMSFFESLT